MVGVHNNYMISHQVLFDLLSFVIKIGMRRGIGGRIAAGPTATADAAACRPMGPSSNTPTTKRLGPTDPAVEPLRSAAADSWTDRSAWRSWYASGEALYPGDDHHGRLRQDSRAGRRHAVRPWADLQGPYLWVPLRHRGSPCLPYLTTW